MEIMKLTISSICELVPIVKNIQLLFLSGNVEELRKFRPTETYNTSDIKQSQSEQRRSHLE